MDFDENLRSPKQRQMPHTPAGGAQIPEGYWRSFPCFEKLLEGKGAPLIASMESTWRQLDKTISSGSPPERARARTVLTAYARALDLYKRFAGKPAAESPKSRNDTQGPHDK